LQLSGTGISFDNNATYFVFKLIEWLLKLHKFLINILKEKALSSETLHAPWYWKILKDKSYHYHSNQSKQEF
jgi:hypothetical protein